MIFKNSLFRLSLVLIFIQQILLAISTWYIADAGKRVSLEQIDDAKFSIIYFFIFAILAYISSSIASLVSAKLKNNIWHQYIIKSIQDTSQDTLYSSEHNAKKTIHWLTGEAPSSINFATTFYLESFSIILNVAFTLFVFYLTLGNTISTALLFALLLSLVLVILLKKKIFTLSNQLQQTNLSVLTFVEPLWNKNIFGNRLMKNEAFKDLDAKMQIYTKTTIHYAYIEQFIACTPIVIGVLIIIGFLLTASPQHIAIGTMVAILPRSLQLFGNVHALSICGSQYLMVKTKIKNLINFTQSLHKSDLENQIDDNKLTILNIRSNIPIGVSSLVNNIISHKSHGGRYLIKGANGSGKSSLLKLIKNILPDSIMLSPNILFSLNENSLSTGQMQLEQLYQILQSEVPCLLLDEWDANLDLVNTQHIDQLIDEKSRNCLIIEVRH